MAVGACGREYRGVEQVPTTLGVQGESGCPHVISIGLKGGTCSFDRSELHGSVRRDLAAKARPEKGPPYPESSTQSGMASRTSVSAPCVLVDSGTGRPGITVDATLPGEGRLSAGGP